MKTDNKGFTLIEIMIVMTLIGIMMGFAMFTFGNVIEGAKISSTKAMLSKVQSMLDAKSQAQVRLAASRPYLVTGSREAKLAAAMFPGNTYAGKVALAKLMEVRYFPQCAADLLDSGNVRGLHAMYPNLVDANGNLVDPGVTPGEVFYDTLTQESSIGSATQIEFSNSEVQFNSRIGGRPEFRDAWGNPIRFYRWPTRLFRPAGQTATATAPTLTIADLSNAALVIPSLPGNIRYIDGSSDIGRDPDDPLISMWAASQPTMFENMTFPGTAISGPTPSTWWTYLVVSAGPDGMFGMYSPDDTAHYGNLGAVQDVNALADDIVSISMKVGSR